MVLAILVNLVCDTGITDLCAAMCLLPRLGRVLQAQLKRRGRTSFVVEQFAVYPRMRRYDQISEVRGHHADR